MEKELKELLDSLESRTREDLELVERAYGFAARAHQEQKRNSGEPYFNHLLATAKNLAELKMDAATIAAGLLHDVLEDTETSRETLEREFGGEILFLVEGVTKLGHLKYHGADRHNESLRKLLVATSEDMRVIIIKLCDRLHNMRTLGFIRPEKQGRIALETLEIYAPIAYRLGIRKLSKELEDLAFQFAMPEGYKEITSLLNKSYDQKLEDLEKFRKSVSKELAKAGFNNFHTSFRVKGLYSLYKKYLKYKKDFDKIYDMLAMRVMVDKTEDCYRALGIIHAAWRPLPGSIKDYIAFPKLNGYQSIHTTVFTGDGGLVEIQIRTEEMHREAEYGVASHILYKASENKKDKKELVPWIKALIDHSPADIKKDFLGERIFAFTPKGDVVDLPKGASIVDFAYAIHSDIGNHMAGAKVNGKLSSFDTALRGGEIVEVVVNQKAKPNRKWLDSAKTSLARKHIIRALS